MRSLAARTLGEVQEPRLPDGVLNIVARAKEDLLFELSNVGLADVVAKAAAFLILLSRPSAFFP
jgi:hypothetical protein